MTRERLFSLLLFVSTVGIAPMALADTVNFTAVNPVQSGSEGTVFTYAVTASAPVGNLGTVYLNGDTPTIVSGPLTVDDTDYENLPIYALAPGQTVTEDFFTVTATPGSAGTTTLGTFDVQGGSDFGTSYDLLGTVNFTATVTSVTPVTATPEPSSLWLLATGGMGGFAALRRRRAVAGVR